MRPRPAARNPARGPCQNPAIDVLITGAGLVGANAARALLERGHGVILLDAAPDDEYVRGIAGAGCELRRGDVTELAALLESTRAAGAIVHTAGLIGPLAQQDPYRAFNVNVVGTLNVAEAAHRAGATRLVYASTHGVYDFAAGDGAPMTESWPTDASSVYSATKLAAEHVLRAYADAHALEVVVLRFCNLFGRGHYRAGSRGGEAFHELITSAVEGRLAPIPSQLAGRSEWLYGKDAARAIAAAVEREMPRGYTVVNVGSGRLTTAADLVSAVRAVVPDSRFGDAESPGRERRAPFDLGTARRVLGWEPAFTLESAVADYVHELRARRSPGAARPS